MSDSSVLPNLESLQGLIKEAKAAINDRVAVMRADEKAAAEKAARFAAARKPLADLVEEALRQFEDVPVNPAGDYYGTTRVSRYDMMPSCLGAESTVTLNGWSINLLTVKIASDPEGVRLLPPYKSVEDVIRAAGKRVAECVVVPDEGGSIPF
jgi:hypothetical protein